MTEPILINEAVISRPDLPRPKVITNFGSTFGAAEVESSAKKLIAFFQMSNLWRGFTFTEILAFYELKGWDQNQMFFGLMGPHYHPDAMFSMWCARQPYVVHDYNKLVVTEAFITRCAQNIKVET